LNTIQKPEKLMERLIKASSNPDDLVFDPFCGSGTMPVVCQRMGRRFIACEINPRYCRIAQDRLSKLEDDAAEDFFHSAASNGRSVETSQVGLL